MKINKENYEAYFIDYLEGNLDEILVNDFIEFLQNNPDLKEELTHFETIYLEPETVDFDKKNSLYKKTLDSENEFSKRAIAIVEDDITIDDKTEFEDFLTEHPEKSRDAALFAKTKLEPDMSVTFRNKRRLYRRSYGRTVMLWSLRVAAVFAIVLSVYVITHAPVLKDQVSSELAIAEDDKIKKEESPAEMNKVPQDPLKKEKGNAVNNKNTVKPKQKQKQEKSLRESTKGRANHDEMASTRIQIEVPDELPSISASMNLQKPDAAIAVMTISLPINAEMNSYEDERLLVDVVKEKTGFDKLPFNKITKAGLDVIASISNDKFQYETNKEGKVTEYKYDSRLLAFSIPGKRSDSE